jgi:hypothetical protein
VPPTVSVTTTKKGISFDKGSGAESSTSTVVPPLILPTVASRHALANGHGHGHAASSNNSDDDYDGISLQLVFAFVMVLTHAL